MLAPLALGGLTLDPPLYLAPMAAITTPATRMIAEEFGATITFTEMVSTAALFRGVDAARSLIVPSSPGHPFAVQIFGVDPHEVEYAAHVMLQAGVDLLDINMGCPMKDIVRHGAGSALMQTPQKAEALVKAARRGVEEKIPVTVKIRAGWDHDSLNAVPFAQRMEQAGASLVTVHGRTRSQLYRGHSDPQVIASVVNAVGIPVIANGDIFSATDAVRLLEITGARGVMVARGSFGNPWIFRDIRAAIAGSVVPPPPSPESRFKVMRMHLEKTLSTSRNDAQQLTEIKKQVAWYSKTLKDSSVFRDKLFRLSSLDEVSALIHEVERECLTTS